MLATSGMMSATIASKFDLPTSSEANAQSVGCDSRTASRKARSHVSRSERHVSRSERGGIAADIEGSAALRGISGARCTPYCRTTRGAPAVRNCALARFAALWEFCNRVNFVEPNRIHPVTNPEAGAMIANSTRSPQRVSPPNRASVAVIGAGPGGLSVAMLLAGAGLDVTILESQPVVGGRTRRLEAGPYAFDCGPTFFMMPYVLEEIFGSVGMATSDFVEMKRLDPMYRLLIGNERGTKPTQIDTTGDLQKMAARLNAVEPGDGDAFLRFIADNRKKLALMEPILRSPIRGLADLMTLDTLKVAPVLRPWESVYSQLTRYFKSEESRLAMSFQSNYLGMSPF